MMMTAAMGALQTTAPMPHGAPDCPGAAAIELEEVPDQLQLMIDKREERLESRRSMLESARHEEDSWKDISEKQLKTLNKWAREDKYLRKAEKATKFTGIPSPTIMILGGVIHNPIVAAVGAVLLLGSIAVKEFSKRRIAKIDREFEPLKREYESSAATCNRAADKKTRLETEVMQLENECASLKARKAQAESDIRNMAGSLERGPEELYNDDEYLVIGGIRLDKKLYNN
ncbi:MAG: hypothetical protein RDV48_06215 [Candidatus Eremiobacteraeota bacterium]|nr:hypothetical protein [Candidatus Eremiobacteraeota bacterium]